MKGKRTSRLISLSLIIFISIFSSVFTNSALISEEFSVAAPAEVNGRILVTSISSSKVSVLLQLNTCSGVDAMGGATIIIGFDTSALGFSAYPIKNTDYFFHNFCGGNYSPATVTRPIANRIWLNIDLPFQNCHEGTVIAGGNNWTDMVTINFDVVDQDGLINVFWLYDSPFWGIYDEDNSTFWNIGQFTDALNIPLPVELSSFNAKVINDKVELNWTTESEVNNYGFGVERKLNENTWLTRGFVAGNGNSNTPNTYSFVDDSLIGGNKFKYRLKQIDTDGSFEYSDVIEVVFMINDFLLHQNFPNPFNSSTKIKYQIPSMHEYFPQNAIITLDVYDILGTKVAAILSEQQQTGTYEIEFNANDLSSGIYFYKLTAGKFSQTKKMLLLK